MARERETLAYDKSLGVIHDEQYPDFFLPSVSTVLCYLANGDRLDEAHKSIRLDLGLCCPSTSGSS